MINSWASSYTDLHNHKLVRISLSYRNSSRFWETCIGFFAEEIIVALIVPHVTKV